MEQHDLTQLVSVVLSAVLPATRSNKWRPNRLRPEQDLNRTAQRSGRPAAPGAQGEQRRRDIRVAAPGHRSDAGSDTSDRRDRHIIGAARDIGTALGHRSGAGTSKHRPGHRTHGETRGKETVGSVGKDPRGNAGNGTAQGRGKRSRGKRGTLK